MKAGYKTYYRKQGKFHWAKLSWFHSLSEKCESFSYESFALSISIHWSLALYRKNITAKSIYCGYRESLAQRKFPCLRYVNRTCYA